MNLPSAPPQRRGSFWSLGNRDLNAWDIGVKLLVWGAVLVGALYLAFVLS
jgi:hypothetical protein